MEIKIKRIAKKGTYTIGKVYINGAWFCDSVEDKDRSLKNTMTTAEVLRKKVYGKTAIPTGKYQLLWTWSNKYKKSMPLINNVPGFEGIRIHSGNTADDSLGCVILGLNKVKGKVLESRATCERFYNLVKPAIAKEKVFITIE